MAKQDLIANVRLVSVTTKLLKLSKRKQGMGGSWRFEFRVPIPEVSDAELKTPGANLPQLKASLNLPKNGTRKTNAIFLKDLRYTVDEGKQVTFSVEVRAMEFDRAFPDVANFTSILSFPLKLGTHEVQFSKAIDAIGGDEPAQTMLTFTFAVDVFKPLGKSEPPPGVIVAPPPGTISSVPPVSELEPPTVTQPPTGSSGTNADPSRGTTTTPNTNTPTTPDTNTTPPTVTRRPRPLKRLVIRLSNPVDPFTALAQMDRSQQDEVGRALNTARQAVIELHKILRTNGAIPEKLPSGKPHPFADLPEIPEAEVLDGKNLLFLKKKDFVFTPPTRLKGIVLSKEQRELANKVSVTLNKFYLAIQYIKNTVKVTAVTIPDRPVLKRDEPFEIEFINAEPGDIDRPVTVKVSLNEIGERINTPVVLKGDKTVAKFYLNGVYINTSKQLLGQKDLPLPDDRKLQGFCTLVGNYGKAKVEASFTDVNGVPYKDFKVIEYDGNYEQEFRDEAKSKFDEWNDWVSNKSNLCNNILIDGWGQLLNAAVDEAKSAGNVATLLPLIGPIIDGFIETLGEASENGIQAILAVLKIFSGSYFEASAKENSRVLKANLENAERLPEAGVPGKREFIHNF